MLDIPTIGDLTFVCLLGLKWSLSDLSITNIYFPLGN